MKTKRDKILNVLIDDMAENWADYDELAHELVEEYFANMPENQLVDWYGRLVEV